MNVKSLYKNKRVFGKPLIMASPKARQTLGIYQVASEVAVKSIMFIDENDKLVYLLCKKYTRGEANYINIYHMALALVHSAWRLPQYFQGRLIMVYIGVLLKKILKCSHYSLKITKWSGLLSALYIEFELRKVEKGQVVELSFRDFLMEDLDI